MLELYPHSPIHLDVAVQYELSTEATSALGVYVRIYTYNSHDQCPSTLRKKYVVPCVDNPEEGSLV
jgi:hypothetical protein